VGVQAKL